MASSTVNWASVTNGIVNSPSTTSTAKSGTDALGSRDTFIKLLMAQIKNQNPLNPTDGVQFVSQLAQFSTLEQDMQVNTTLTGIQTSINKLVSAGTGTAGNTQG